MHSQYLGNSVITDKTSYLKYINSLTKYKYEKIFLENGYQIFKLNRNCIKKIKEDLIKKIRKKTKLKNINLENFHKYYPVKKVNNLRLNLYKEINSDQKFQKQLYNSSKKMIDDMVGSEIAKSKSNLSIQYPNDDKSVLSIHTDFFSGESLFQVNFGFPCKC